MAVTEQWITWSPPWAKHVKGKYTRRVRGDEGFCEPQKITMECTHVDDGRACGARWQTVCNSGNVRRHINNFAIAHAHKDFTKPPRIVRPNSKRSSVLDEKAKA
jgi:hypothetical protein